MELYGVEEAALDSAGVTVAGRTDGAIARDLLDACGVEDFELEALVERVCARFAELCPPSLADKVAPGIPGVLARLGADSRFRQSLLTGNFKAVAHLKLQRAGLARFFEGGAFGSDAEDRGELPPVARARAGGWPRERTVVIGDTPNDIACARADGVRVIAVATGPFAIEQLADADAVVDSAPAVVPILEDWARSRA